MVRSPDILPHARAHVNNTAANMILALAKGRHLWQAYLIMRNFQIIRTQPDPIGILVRESERPTNRENNHKRRGREVGDLGSGGHKSMQQKQ